MNDFLDTVKLVISNELNPEDILLIDNSKLHKKHKLFDSKKFSEKFFSLGSVEFFSLKKLYSETAGNPYSLYSEIIEMNSSVFLSGSHLPVSGYFHMSRV